MKKPKTARVPIRIDMTPMVDVAFLLLTFFMLTTQFKPPEEVDVILPDSNSVIKLPESDVITLSISKTGEVYMGVDSQFLRASLFGEENRLRMAVQLTLEQLTNKLIEARTRNPKLRTVIKCDKDTEYGVVMDVMDVLLKTNISRFNLVTNLEAS
jgi:biopolymer transport protein ExbD